jgi:tight adherence protein B
VPDWLIIVMLAVVFTTVLSVGQGVYWAYIARQERRQAEILRRLGGGASDAEMAETLFRDTGPDVGGLGTLGRNIATSLVAADSDLSISALLLRMGAAGLVGMMLMYFAAGLAGAAIGIGFAYAPLWLLNRQAATRATTLVSQLPDALELMSRSLQAGLGLNDAFRLVAEEMPMPISGEFGRVFEEVRFGRDYREAFLKMLDRNPSVFDLRLMVSSVLLQRETGGNLIEILENIAETIRGRFVFHAKVRAMTAEARISATILGGLPLVVILILRVSSPDYLLPLVNDPIGNLIVAVCVIMYALGTFIMRDLANVEA